jgi:phosphate transport system protein
VASEPRHRFQEDLRQVEAGMLDAIALVVPQLDRALEAIAYQDVELVAVVVAGDARIDARYAEVHDAILELIARQAPVAGDLRLVFAVLHSIRCVERMGDQCVNIAKLVALSGHEARKDHSILDLIARMGAAVREQLAGAREAFATRHAALARDVSAQDAVVNVLNREVFKRAVEVGDDPELREWAMFMVLAGRCLERIGDNAVDVAEQAVFAVTGAFAEPPASTIGN